MAATALKYLFIAVYKDGTIFVQNKEDRSATDPKRSAFFDVDHGNLRQFILSGSHKRRYLVDVTDGHFEVDGVPFRFHDPDSHLKTFCLIFFRKHKHHANVNVQSGKIARQWEDPIVYRLGWEAVDPFGNKVQRVMEID